MNKYKIEFIFEGDDFSSAECVNADTQEEAQEKFINRHRNEAFWLDIVSVSEVS